MIFKKTLLLLLDKTIYIGTTTFAYFIINSVKLIPYYYLDLLAPSNLKISIALIPVAILSVLLGYFLQKKVSQEVFYNIIYLLLFCPYNFILTLRGFFPLHSLFPSQGFQ